MTTFTIGLMLLPMSCRASNTFTRTYGGNTGAPEVGAWALFSMRDSSLKEQSVLIRGIYWGGRRTTGELDSACLKGSPRKAMAPPVSLLETVPSTALSFSSCVDLVFLNCNGLVTEYRKEV